MQTHFAAQLKMTHLQLNVNANDRRLRFNLQMYTNKLIRLGQLNHLTSPIEEIAISVTDFLRRRHVRRSRIAPVSVCTSQRCLSSKSKTKKI